MIQVLRLMILLSKTTDGLSTGDYNQLSSQFLHVILILILVKEIFHKISILYRHMGMIRHFYSKDSEKLAYSNAQSHS